MLATKELYPEVNNFFSTPAILALAKSSADEQQKQYQQQPDSNKKNWLEKLLTRFSKANKQPITPSENYLRRIFPTTENNARYQIEAVTSPEQIAEIFRRDFEHIFREMIRVEKETHFSITISAVEEAARGDGYGESMDWLLANFAHEIGQQGLPASRAVLEQLVFKRNYAQLLTIAQQHLEKTVPIQPNQFQPNSTASNTHHLTTELPKTGTYITSPPGTFADGYHGIDTLTNWNGKEFHHAFHFWSLLKDIIYTFDSNGRPQLTSIDVDVAQFRTWHNIQGLLDLHQELGSPIQILEQQPITHQILANAFQIEFPAHTSNEEIAAFWEKTLYVNQKDWAKNPDQAPKLSDTAEALFWNELGIDKQLLTSDSFFNQAFLQPVLSLLKNTTATHLNNPERRALLIAHLDLRTEMLVRAIELRVRELNTNPAYNQLVRENLLTQLIKNPLNAKTIFLQLKALTDQETGQPLTEPERLKTFKKTYKLYEKKTIYKEELTDEESEWLGVNLGGVVAIGDFAFGSMQCFTIGSLQLPFKAAQLATPGGLSTNLSEALNLVDTQTKRQILERLKAQNYVELDLRHATPSANRVWMVPASYLGGAGCRVDETGMVCGPCMSDEYPLGIPFDHPLEQNNPYGPLPMDQHSFNEYLKNIEQSILRDELATQLATQDMSEPDRVRTQLLIDRLISTLFKVNLTTLIAGVDEYDDPIHQLPEKTIKQITSIDALEQLVLHLEENKDQAELEQLIAIANLANR